ncbi:uncharacterized protein Dwil_GK23312 [Drosophila willistoni]|uniref:Gustatory receptor n=1 Tax=Drosophila willistoni TaxID=7260 RepID=B4NNH1_DROWI|nr:putative gustatory receptor 57a [Drosophila willistoni]EDW85910.1 uncharacterized protein Dwil_GK23312 [Drosophila willistoni]
MTVLFFFPEPNTFYDCVRFICDIQFFMCCNGFFHLEISLWSRIYSIVFAFLIIFGLFGSLVFIMLDGDLRSRVLEMDNLVLSIVGLELVMSTMVFVVTMMTLQLSAWRHLSIYTRMAKVDKRLIRDFGANLNYRKLLRKNVVLLTIISLLYVGAITRGLALISGGQQILLILVAALCYIVVTGGPHFTGYIHMRLAELLTIRFRLLQQILNRNFLNWKFPKPQIRDQRLREAVEMVQELHYLIVEINEVYSLSLWSAMGHDFTLSTSELYIIFGRSVGIDPTEGADPDDLSNGTRIVLAYVALCMLPPFYKMLIAPFYCDRTVQEARQCLHLIEQLDNWYPANREIHNLVEALMKWRRESQIKFKSGLDVVLDKTVISLFTSTVFNYLLILIQFSMTQKMGEQIEQQKIALQDWIGS